MLPKTDRPHSKILFEEKVTTKPACKRLSTVKVQSHRKSCHSCIQARA